MKILNLLIIFLAFFFCIFVLKGQDNMVIHFVNSSNATFDIEKIKRITFNGDNMVLKTISGTENSYLLDNIAFVTFFVAPIGIPNIEKSIEVNVYQNAVGEIIAESQHLINGLTVFDISGKVVKVTRKNSVNINALSTGLYLLRIETTQGTVTKKFIKNR